MILITIIIKNYNLENLKKNKAMYFEDFLFYMISVNKLGLNIVKNSRNCCGKTVFMIVYLGYVY